MLNVTVTGTAGHGFATIYPCTTTVPTASNLNYAPSQTVPNMAVAKLSATGTICVYTLATTHLIIDANGYIPADSTVTPTNPARLLETRPGEKTIVGQHQGQGAVAGGSFV